MHTLVFTTYKVLNEFGKKEMPICRLRSFPIRTVLLICLVSTIGLNATAQLFPITVTTTTLPPVDPFITNSISKKRISVSVKNTDTSEAREMFLYGSIKRMSPSPFTISLQENFTVTPFTLKPGENANLNFSQLSDAFGNFDLDNLDVSGIDPSALTDPANPKNIKLPDGVYSFCIYARSDYGCSVTCALSNPNLGCGTFTIACAPKPNSVKINTMALPPVIPNIRQYIASGNLKSTVQFIDQSGCNTRLNITVLGKIERLSPAPFTITPSQNYIPQFAVAVNSTVMNLTPSALLDALANLNESFLDISGIDPTALKDASNQVRLPDGNYKVCFYAREYINGALGNILSDINLGCAVFTICNKAGGAPQLTQPINGLNVSSPITIIQPTSPLIFSWTPPQSTCGLPIGGYQYAIELHEILDNQTIIDALNNPFVFRKNGLPATTFLLDTNLYKNVVQRGKRYIIRVQASSTNSRDTLSIENDGFSRVEAFQYGGVENTILSPLNVSAPDEYYIPYIDRKTDALDDVYTAYLNHQRSDTLIPVKDYIALMITENGTVCNPDAVELFLALNPDIAKRKEVPLSYQPNMPVYPKLTNEEQRQFEEEYITNLQPDLQEQQLFNNYLDSLQQLKSKLIFPEETTAVVNNLMTRLEANHSQLATANRVTAKFINQLLAELTYEISSYTTNSGKTAWNYIQNIITNINELVKGVVNTTGWHAPVSIQKYSLSNIGLSQLLNNPLYRPATYLPAKSQLVPFKIVVWRYAKESPPRAVLEAPDLKNIFRIYYTTPALYNAKNPEIRANTTARLASTTQIILPSYSTYRFWTLNMRNHQMSKVEDIEISDFFLLKNKKDWPDTKVYRIILKVD